ncbi:CPBP family intramembrane glutamic endopeptidase [Paramuribaculum intestinale]|uniref:CPBP family intramembrane glutamic endopeptidase n=2 Tax=Paramuribaculum intestinale TaxID=2094151 RepID=UPI00197CE44F|nr:CPBP family intramembrane glutamic endopeptidase [Paramuribaculum intestinale]MBJ2185483.1 CPBP family intramembrane metalloprotease [Muribaculaceae bacterium]
MVIAIVLRTPTTPHLRIAAILQDLLMFVVPTIATAVIVTRYPARLLMIDSRPTAFGILLTVLAIIVMIPFMNVIVAWNESIRFPESMSALEEFMKNAEANAAAMTRQLMGTDTIGSIIMSILIIGLLAGFSEELFFRGALQRLLSTAGMNIHVAIWLTAFIFSAVHMQFYGFVPRMLLGAMFGYMAVWSGSLWIAVIAHATNNSLVVIAQSVADSGGADINQMATDATPLSMAIAVISLMATVGIMYMFYRIGRMK